jgi:inorganic triphosphatase YgiF
MIETELKFQVPASQLARLRKAVATATARTVRLEARYFDTPERALASARLALRLRREGDRWVQAVKGAGDGLMRRLEHQVTLPGRRPPAGVDLALHDVAAPVARTLRRVLGGQAGALRPIYSTDVQRTVRDLRAGGASIELALDEGVIRAEGREAPICEVEFELTSGDPAVLAAVAARWARRHGLWLDPRSKAERGERLALGIESGPAVKAHRPVLRADLAAPAALARMVDACLRQVLANAAEIADGHGRAEHVHQLRVGLRRLRSVLRSFGAWAIDPAAARALEVSVRPLFAALGTRRDRDVVTDLLSGPLHAGGHALPDLPPAPADDEPATVVRSADFATVMLQAIALAATCASTPGVAPSSPRLGESGDSAEPGAAPDPEPAAGADPEPPQPAAAGRLRPLARKALARLWKRIEAEAQHFADIDEAQRHDLRKRAKRLRYSLEFMAALFPARPVAAFLAALAEAQEAIGAYNDMVTAGDLLRGLDARDPAVAYAAGWVASQRLERLRDCERPLRRLLKAPRPWTAGR